MKVQVMCNTMGVSRTHFDFYLLPYVRLYRLNSFLSELEDKCVKNELYIGLLLWSVRFTFNTKY